MSTVPLVSRSVRIKEILAAQSPEVSTELLQWLDTVIRNNVADKNTADKTLREIATVFPEEIVARARSSNFFWGLGNPIKPDTFNLWFADD